MDSHLAQIRTGEGKSVTLGVLAVFNALLGYDVDVACYSGYLSVRDYDGFKDIFELFDVSGNIEYGTFESLADRLGDPTGQIRSIAKCFCSAVTGSAASVAQSSISNRPKMLLVDEFDQVLDPGLYGQEHRYSTKIEHPKITELMQHIYTNNLGPADWASIQEVPLFIELGQILKRPILVSAVRNMLQCRETLDDHKYVVKDGRIGYTLHDGINFDMSYGYHTAFAYQKEATKGTVSPKAAASKLFIPVVCGEFSYAEIVKKYLRVFGVSGTLPESPEDREIVEQVYKITKRTVVPSMFGDSCLEFPQEANTCVEPDVDNWHMAVTKETLAQIKGSQCGSRAIVICFETIEALQAFEDAPFGGKALDAKDGVKVQRITEMEDNKTKSRRTDKASGQGVVTYITRALGRGTDFFCRDGTVLKNGGVHVLQTFWSIDRSEQIQIMGRTARQGQVGSYSLVLCRKHLERLGVEPTELQMWIDSNTVHAGLRSASNQLCAEAKAPRVVSAADCLKRHTETIKMYEMASTGADLSTKMVKFLKKRNPSPASLGATKLVLAIDGTSSMAGVIGKTKATITEMLSRIQQVLDEAHASDAAYQIQIVAYRNYNAQEPDELLQISSWQTSPTLLKDFLGTVNASYGWGSEAVELALAHANRVLADLVVVIGDADAQRETAVHSKRLESSKAPWNSDPRFSTPTYYEPEAKLLAERGCPVSTFFVPKGNRNGCVPPGFQTIADCTGGNARVLNVNDSQSGADLLTDAVCTQILGCLGNKSGLDLVDLYNKATFN